MDLNPIASAVQAAFEEVGLATMDALRDDSRIRTAARIALELAPYPVRQLVHFTIGLEGFEAIVLRLRNRLVAAGTAQRGALSRDEMRRILVEGLRSEALLAAPHAHQPVAGDLSPPPVQPSPGAPHPIAPAIPGAVPPPRRPIALVPATPVGTYARSQPVNLAVPNPALTAPSRPTSTSATVIAPTPAPATIDITELKRLLDDDTTPDHLIAPYLRAAPDPRFPGVPVLNVETSRVSGVTADDRGSTISGGDLFGLGVRVLNDRSNRARQRRFQERIGAGWSGPRLLAEGDSWFQYPILLKDVVDHLAEDHAVYSLAEAGDTLDNMVRGQARLEKSIGQLKIDALLISGGGNDIAGEALANHIAPWTAGCTRAENLIAETSYNAFLTSTQEKLEHLFKSLGAGFPGLRIFIHGYDWPKPAKHGPWLSPALQLRKVPADLQGPVLRLLIDRYYDTLHSIAARHPGRVTVVDCRGVVDGNAWYDELHPDNIGFARAADRFRTAIADAFGLRSNRTPDTGLCQAFEISWVPAAASGNRERHSRTVRVGRTISVGRHADRDIHLPDELASRLHARVDVTENGVVIDDLGSSNGTMLEGERIKQAQWLPGQIVTIGGHLFSLARSNSETAGGNAAVVVPSSALPAERTVRSIEFQSAVADLAAWKGKPLVVGLFDNVGPLASAGAPLAVDVATDGRLSALFQAGRLRTSLGSVELIASDETAKDPTPVLVIGLGPFDTFGPSTITRVARALIEASERFGLSEFVTVPIGCNVGLRVSEFAEAFVTGVSTASLPAGGQAVLRSLTICDLDPTRVTALDAALAELAADAPTRLGLNVQLTPSMPAPASAARAKPQLSVIPFYLLVTQPDPSSVNVTVLSSKPGGAIFSYTQSISGDGASVLAHAMRRPDAHEPELGRSLASAVLPTAALDAIAAAAGTPNASLVFVHDRSSANIPWEAIYLADHCPALRPGISRLYRIDGSTLRSGSTMRRPRGEALRLLIVDNPTEDLKWAQKEVEAIRQRFEAGHGVVETISGRQASREAVLNAIDQGDFDILHYAGHAAFAENAPGSSGLKLAGGALTASDLAALRRVPQLIFLNACESGRIRGASPGEPGGDGGRGAEFLARVSLAEALLVSGVGSFIGTYWPVDDFAAGEFATGFYDELLAGRPMAAAMRAARQRLVDINSKDWANYLHFGDPTTILRQM